MDAVREMLRMATFRREAVEEFLDPERPTHCVFDRELGYVPASIVLMDGMDYSYSTYTYEAGGFRRLVNHPERPCRINTYGDSFTQCQQVSDGETWQEYLAAHIGEPIRNFGCGGYGVYQSYWLARRVEASELGVKYVVLNVWDDDHIRNLDASRWIRTSWDQREWPPEQKTPLHALPWVHLRFDLGVKGFVHIPSQSPSDGELRALCEPDRFYETFKNDHIVHLYALRHGLDAEVDELQAIAEALNLDVDLRDLGRRSDDAGRLHLAYGLRSTLFMFDTMLDWAQEQGKKLMVLLSYGQGNIRRYLEDGVRFDQSIVDYLKAHEVSYVDGLAEYAKDAGAYGVPADYYLQRQFIQPAGAAVFGHYNPKGNHFFAFSIKSPMVDWLDPKPPAYKKHVR